MEFLQILFRLVALYLKNTELASEKRARLRALLLEEPETISGDPKIIAKILAAKPEFNRVSHRITDENFPTTVDPSLEDARTKDCYGGHSVEAALLDLLNHKRRGASAAETLAYLRASSHMCGKWTIGIGQFCIIDDAEYFVGVKADGDWVQAELIDIRNFSGPLQILHFPA